MSVAKSSFLFAGGTLISRISGLVRDRVVAAVFGATELMGGFVIAFRIPNMLREMLAEGALGGSFTKVYSELYVSDRQRAHKLFFDTMFLMSLVSILVCALGILLAPWVVQLMTSDNEQSAVLVRTATGLTRLLFPFLGFMVLGAIVMGALHQKGQFFLTSVSPIMFNIVNVAGAYWVADWFARHAPDWVETMIADKAIVGFTVTVVLGGLAQLVVQLVGVVREFVDGFRVHSGGLPWSEDVKKVLTLMAPMALAASAGQINTIVNSYFATTVSPGAVSWLYYAFRLLHFPIGIFGVAIGAAVLPQLSRTLAKAGGVVNASASREIQNAVEMVLWLMAPCFVFYLVNNLQLVQCLFQSGRFTPEDSAQTALALNAYAYALISYGLSKVMTSFYFALERTKFALRVSLVTVATNVAVNWMFVQRFGHAGLAYGYSVTQALGVCLYIYGMRGRGITLDRPRLVRSLTTLVLAGAVSGGVMLAVRELLVPLDALQSLRVWMSSGLIILANGAVCGAIFVIFGLGYLRVGPKKALALLQARRRGRAQPTPPSGSEK